MITLPLRLSFDEIAAVARLASVETPPYLVRSQDLEQALVDSGVRSLICREMLSVGSGDQVPLNDGLVEAVRLMSRSTPSLAMRSRTLDGDVRTGRLLPTSRGPLIVEEPLHVGVVVLTGIERSAAGAIVNGYFALDGASAPAEGSTINEAALWLTGDEGAQVLTWIADSEGLWMVSVGPDDLVTPAERLLPEDVSDALLAMCDRLDTPDVPAFPG